MENLPKSITSGAITESYTYDADDERVSRAVTQNGTTTTTYYFGGIYEEERPSGKTRSLYSLNGQVVAQKELTPPTAVTTLGTNPNPPIVSGDAAAFVSQSVPTSVSAGQRFQVSVTMRNSGTSTWTDAAGYRLGSQNPQDNTTWGMARVNLASTVSVASGGQHTFTFTATAPSTPGTYNFRWRMVREGVQWFGELSANVGIVVSAAPTVYLHSDHLGSVSVATNGAGAVVSQQQYDPWGRVRSGGVTQTDLNYTGQRKYDTGLLYYHARYYDPSVGRFISSDAIVPTTSDILAVSYSKNWLTDAAREHARNKSKAAPESPQELNRYSYVGNNPLRYTDPSGHCRSRDGMDSRPYGSSDCAPSSTICYAQGVCYKRHEVEAAGGAVDSMTGGSGSMMGPYSAPNGGGGGSKGKPGAGAGKVPTSARKYVPHAKHAQGRTWDNASEMDLDDVTAQQVLDKGYLSANGRSIFSYHNGELYEYKYDGVGNWHGYKLNQDAAGYRDVPTEYLRQLRDQGTLTNAQYNRWLRWAQGR